MTKLSSKQWLVLSVGAVLILVSELFPPWQYQYNYIPSWTHVCPAGYGFITHPPAVKLYDEMLAICGTSEVPLSEIATRRDVWRSNYQRFILGLFILGLLLTVSAHQMATQIVAGALVLIGILGIIGNFLIVPFLYL